MNSDAPEVLPYEMLGGEAGVRELCKRFYEVMDQDSKAAHVRAMHGASLESIEEKLFEYLSGWMGGPHIYKEKYGTVCLTEPHAPYAIDEQARDEWLYCMDRALEKINASDELKEMLKEPVYNLANFIRNV